VNVELINTGSELMLGRVLNTHQQWLCRQLADAGYVVSRQVAVPDTGPAIQDAVREALSQADLIITTGGLGPTSDDITRDLIASLLGRRLREDHAALQNIERFFSARNRPVPERTKIQAQVPDGAIVLQNENGTAPGLCMEVCPNSFRKDGASSWLIMLPGPPRELRPMFRSAALSIIKKHLPLSAAFSCRTLRTTGLGESLVEQMVAPSLESLARRGLDVGYCARPGQVDVRLSSGAPDGEGLVAEGEKLTKSLLKKYFYGMDDDELENVLVSELRDRKETLCLAESCTGGEIANRITNVAGASAIFLAGWVTYSNEAKQKFLGVPPEIIATHGAVSEKVAAAMAQGARKEAGADYALSVTGIAGPDGGTEEKPVGTVFIGIADETGVKVEKHYNPYDRETFKDVTASQALDLLRRTLRQQKEPPHYHFEKEGTRP
jgi:nicotinamide-nucleotide amidase